jgi:hypothetical protein
VGIFSGWREQYERMLRSYDRLVAHGRGDVWASSDEARDDLVRFFQDAFHLRDWIKNDRRPSVPQAARDDVGDAVDRTTPLQICADIANGSKHLVLDPKRPTKTRDVNTAITGQSVTVRPATVTATVTIGAETSAPPPRDAEARPAIHSWRIESGGVSYDAIDLAGKVVAEWQTWLRGQGMLS